MLLLYVWLHIIMKESDQNTEIKDKEPEKHKKWGNILV